MITMFVCMCMSTCTYAHVYTCMSDDDFSRTEDGENPPDVKSVLQVRRYYIVRVLSCFVCCLRSFTYFSSDYLASTIMAMTLFSVPPLSDIIHVHVHDMLSIILHVCGSLGNVTTYLCCVCMLY